MLLKKTELILKNSDHSNCCDCHDIYLLHSRVGRLLNKMESWQRFFHNKRKQNIRDEMFCPWPSNNSEKIVRY